MNDHQYLLSINEFYRLKLVCRFIGITFLMAFMSCSRQVLKSPVEEIDRGISLPQNNWLLTTGAGISKVYNYKYHNSFPHLFTLEGDFWYPYVILGDYTELHLRILAIRQYLIKKTSIIDSTVILTGPNLAITFGINGAEYANSRFGVSLISMINCRFATKTVDFTLVKAA